MLAASNETEFVLVVCEVLADLPYDQYPALMHELFEIAQRYLPDASGFSLPEFLRPS
jgi:hypothetical protein